MSLRLPAPSGARLRDVLRCGATDAPASGVDQRVGGSLSETETSGWSGLPRWLRWKLTSKVNETDTATTAKEKRPDYDLMISQYDDLVRSYYESLYKGLHEGEQSDEGLMIGSRMHDLQNELEDAERERHLSVEQITKLQSSRFKERMATNDYWKEVALVKINEKLDMYEDFVNRTDNIEELEATKHQLLPIFKWLVDHRPQFTTTHVDRFGVLNDQFMAKFK